MKRDTISQLVLVFVFAKILNQLTSYNFFYKWLTSYGLECFVSPKDQLLRSIDSNHRGKCTNVIKKPFDHENTKDREARLRSHMHCSKEFKINTSDISQHIKSYDSLVLRYNELCNLVFGVEVEWIADLALISLFAILITEIQSYLISNNELNLSLVWAAVIVSYCIHILGRLTWAFFRLDQSIGERSVCICMFCLFFLISLSLLILVSHETLEFNFGLTKLDAGWLLFLKLIVSVWCGFVGSILSFPGLRFGQMHMMLLDEHTQNRLSKILCTINYVSSFVISIMWITPVARRPFTDPEWSVGITTSHENFEIIRIYLIMFFSIYRIIMLPQYLQSYLRLSEKKMQDVRRRGTTVTNLFVHANFANVYEYTNIVILHYIIPAILCIFTCLMLKIVGSYSWLPLENAELMVNPTNETIDNALNVSFGQFQDLQTAIQTISILFSTAVIRQILGFATWWLHFAWFCTTSMGLLYHSYFKG